MAALKQTRHGTAIRCMGAETYKVTNQRTGKSTIESPKWRKDAAVSAQASARRIADERHLAKALRRARDRQDGVLYDHQVYHLQGLPGYLRKRFS